MQASYFQVSDNSTPDKEIRRMRDYIECMGFVMAADKAQNQKLAGEKMELQRLIDGLIESQQQQAEKLLDLEEKLAESNRATKFLKSQLVIREQMADEIEIGRHSMDQALHQVEALSLELATTKLQVRVMNDQLTDAKMEIKECYAEKEALQKSIKEEKAEKWQVTKELKRLKQLEVDACMRKQALRDVRLSAVDNNDWWVKIAQKIVKKYLKKHAVIEN